MQFEVNAKQAYAYTGGKTFDAKLPTVVFVHGAQHDHSVWILQSRYLAHHGYGVLAVDLPGHGRSAGPALASIGELAEWIGAVQDAAGVKQAAIVGHSMGSLIALECAARHPDRVVKIALLAIAYPMKVSTELLDATKNNEPLAQDMVNIWSHLAYAQYPNNPGPGFWVIGENLRLMQRQKPGVMYVDFTACNAYAGGAEAATRVRCPALLLLARRDSMTPVRAAQDFAKSIEGAQVVVIDGSGHNMMAEKPDEVLDTLVAFLK
ncbi:MAG: alpha/beta hydrolase [Betaproteobacteria bacterium RIFCSPLOWO2_12_FULL_64_23]|nr:MAG: alpha/beta hydrolase [Betaproteobacteria bacterium RIFCSPLOWO2_12_FULL_64_23]